MRRVAPCAVALALAGCAAGVRELPCEVQPDKAEKVTITVDTYAKADKECVDVKNGVTEVVWVPARGIRKLVIGFKEDKTDAYRLDDPDCDTGNCTLERTAHDSRAGDYEYSILVLRDNGSTATYDPRLVIRP
jgi:hypothetical protein